MRVQDETQDRIQVLSTFEGGNQEGGQAQVPGPDTRTNGSVSRASFQGRQKQSETLEGQSDRWRCER